MFEKLQSAMSGRTYRSAALFVASYDDDEDGPVCLEIEITANDDYKLWEGRSHARPKLCMRSDDLVIVGLHIEQCFAHLPNFEWEV